MDNQSKNTARKSPPKVSVEATSDSITSHAGLLPIIRFLDQFGILKALKDRLSIERPSNALYQAADVVIALIIGIIGGGTNIDQVVNIWRDKVLRKIAGYDSIPHPSNFGRIFCLFNFRMVSVFESLVHSIRQAIWKSLQMAGKLPQLCASIHWIDIDSTVETTFGEQEGAKKGYNPHKKGALSFHPLLAFLASTKEVLQGWFRSGDAYTSNGATAFLKQLFASLKIAGKIIVRGDSGFFDGELLSFLETGKYGFLIKAKMYPTLKMALCGQTWSPVKNLPGFEETTFFFKCENWKEPRKFYAVRQKVVGSEKTLQEMLGIFKYDYYCYVSSENFSPLEAHKLYGKRATCENLIEELKNQTALGDFRSHDFWASSAMFQCAILAYNTICWMRLASGNEILKTWEVQTIRSNLIRLGGKLVENARQLTLKIQEVFFHKPQWDAWLSISA